MKYLLTIYGDETRWEHITPEEGQAIMNAYWAFQSEVETAGAFIAGEGLQSTGTATTVRVRDGERMLTDGPFAETKEQLGGFYMVDAKDLDEAVAWAARIPTPYGGCVEVRPIWEIKHLLV